MMLASLVGESDGLEFVTRAVVGPVGLDEDEVADGSTWCSMPLPAAMLAASMAL